MTATSTDDTTIFTPRTSTAKKEQVVNHLTSSVPQPGKTFIIRETKSGHLLTLLNGNACLRPAGTRGSAHHWTCHEKHGWLGFKNVAAGKFLGHDLAGTLHATVARHQGWENFCVRMTPEGGYVLLMTHWEKLWPVKIKHENGLQKLCKADAPVKHGLVWEFVQV